MAVLIPIVREKDGTGAFEQQATLDGKTYTLDFLWNVRMGSWFMNVLDANGTAPLIVGIRLVTDWRLARASVDHDPPGAFVLIDTATARGKGQDPGFDDIGNRHQLWYLTEADVRTLRSF